MLQNCPSLEFITDDTERRVNHPNDKTDRKTYYSGKKKTHTVKNLVIHDRKGKVRHLSDTYEGKKHDKKIADQENLRFPPGSTVWQDTGFQGFAPKDVTIQQPKKKPRNRSLSAIEKMNNQSISSLRVEVEHHIRGIKRCQVLVHLYRLSAVVRETSGHDPGQSPKPFLYQAFFCYFAGSCSFATHTPIDWFLRQNLGFSFARPAEYWGR